MNSARYCSPTSFCSAYGDSGLGRHVLALRQRRRVAVGGRGAGVDQALDARVARGHQHVQRRVDVGAVRRDRIARPSAAPTEWRPGAARSPRPPTARRATATSARSPSMNSTPGTCARFARLPVIRLSTTRTRSPRRASSSQRCDPMKPAPPVTRYKDIGLECVNASADSVSRRCSRRSSGSARLTPALGCRKAPQRSRKPNSVPPSSAVARLRGLRRTLADDDHSSSPAIAGGIKQPTRRHRTGRPDSASLFGLAPCGVLPATDVAAGAVRSYRTFSPLPASALRAPAAGFGAAALLSGRPRGLPRRSAEGAKSGGIFSVPLSFRSP